MSCPLSDWTGTNESGASLEYVINENCCEKLPLRRVQVLLHSLLTNKRVLYFYVSHYHIICRICEMCRLRFIHKLKIPYCLSTTELKIRELRGCGVVWVWVWGWVSRNGRVWEGGYQRTVIISRSEWRHMTTLLSTARYQSRDVTRLSRHSSIYIFAWNGYKSWVFIKRGWCYAVASWETWLSRANRQGGRDNIGDENLRGVLRSANDR